MCCVHWGLGFVLRDKFRDRHMGRRGEKKKKKQGNQGNQGNGGRLGTVTEQGPPMGCKSRHARVSVTEDHLLRRRGSQMAN